MDALYEEALSMDLTNSLTELLRSVGALFG